MSKTGVLLMHNQLSLPQRSAMKLHYPPQNEHFNRFVFLHLRNVWMTGVEIPQIPTEV